MPAPVFSLFPRVSTWSGEPARCCSCSWARWGSYYSSPAPAWHASNINLSDSLKESGRSLSAARRHQSLRRLLVAAQTAISVVLLIGAGLLLRSFVRLSQVDLGFNPQNTLTMNVALPPGRYRTDAQM